MIRLLALTMVGGIFLANAAMAEPVPALAMYDAPRYTAGFDHLDYVNPDAPKGGLLRRAETGTFDNLNPFLLTGRITTGLQEALLQTYDSLMVRAWNEPFTMYGLVASSVEVPPERDWIIFHLDPEAKFNDGHAITADDVLFSYQTLMQYGRPNQRRIYKLVTRATVVDAQTIRFDLGPGFDRETVMILSGMPILPQHYWQDRDFGKTTLIAPLGSGPYRVKAVDPGRRVVFERVKNYWAADKPINRGLYNFDGLQFDFYRDDHVALQALSSGQADLRREWSAVAWLRDYRFNAVATGAVTQQVFRNGRPSRARFFVYNMRRPLFNDVRVREALADAFDFDWVNTQLFYGTQTRVASLFMNAELADQGADKFVPPAGGDRAAVRDNLRHALALLGEAGWTLQDGVLENVAHQPFRFEILLNDPNDEKVALAYARGLQKLGITATIRTVDTAQYVGRMSQFDFDMTVNFWRNSLSPGTEQAVYWGSQAADTQGSFNYSGLKSPVIDGLITHLTTAQNRAGLITAAHALDHAVMAQWIGVPLYDAPEDRIAYRSTIQHPATTPLYGPIVESWWYDAKKSGKQVSNDSTAH